MRMKRVFLLGCPFFVAAVVTSACGAPPNAGRVASPTAAEPRGGARHAAETDHAVAGARKARGASPSRAAPPRVTTPMAGEPTPKALAEARLVPTTCEAIDSAEVEAKLKAMRAAVDASYRTWHDEQPACWEADREQAEWQKQGGGRRHRYRAAQDGGGGGAGWGDALGAVAGRPSAAPRPMPSAAAPATASPPPAKAAQAPAQEKRKDAPAANAPRAAESVSGTNNQVASVDEADIVKTDGRYVYFAANGALRIAEAMNPKMISVTRIPGNSVKEMFVEGDRAVVYTSTAPAGGQRCTYGYDCAFGGDGSSTKVVVLDVTNRLEPKVVREIDLSGSLVAARRIGNAVHTVVADGERATPDFEAWPVGMDTCGTAEAEVKKKFAELKAQNERRIRAKTSRFPTMRENGADKPLCSGLLTTAMNDSNAFTSLVSFDLKDDKQAPQTSTVRTRSGAVFASADALYVSVVHQKQASGGRWYSYYPTTSEASEIHKFRIGASPKDTKYVGSGTVPGHVLSQMSMDEWSGYLRIATTKGKVPDPKVSSVVSILAEGENGNLVRVGAVDEIAPGEDIRAVRFDDDRGYVVTFKKTDPLFVLDLYQPARPRILGELKIPGFSTYIHRIDQDHLLSIGFDANDHGDFAYFDGVILQLFDVKSPTDPRLVHKEKIGSRGSSSAAATDHLAFNYFADRGLLAVPMTVCDGGGDGRNGDKLSFSGLLVYDVDAEKGFTKLGGIDHGTKGVSCGTWWSNATSTVKRSVFLDDLVYSVAGDRAKVQRLGLLGKDVADLSLTQ